MTRLNGVPLVSLALIVAVELVDAAHVRAQVRVTTLDELRRTLAAGDEVSLRTGSDSVSGRLLRLGEADLDIRAEVPDRPGRRRAVDVSVPLDAIQVLERRRDSSRNGALIGAGVGAAAIGAMFARAVAIDRNEMDEWAPIYLGYGAVFAGIGALVGWAVDSAHSKPHVRFERRPTDGLEVRAAPLRRGMAVMVAF